MASIVISGDTSGTVTLAAPTVAGTQSYTLPTAVPAANGYALTSTTGGTMSWAAITAIYAQPYQLMQLGLMKVCAQFHESDPQPLNSLSLPLRKLVLEY